MGRMHRWMRMRFGGIEDYPTKDESFVILTEVSLRALSLVKKMVFESLEPGSVIFECKEGPYVKHEEEGILDAMLM